MAEYEHLGTLNSSNTRCPVCGADRIRVRSIPQDFAYGVGDDQVTLSVRVPINVCEECGFSFTDYRAEEIRHNAVCRHLGLLTPDEIRGIRAMHNKSQKEFASITGIGEASLARWESGAKIQNKAMDKYLRLLRVPQIFSTLDRDLQPTNQANATDPVPEVAGSRQLIGKFRCIDVSNENLHAAASYFELRRAA